MYDFFFLTIGVYLLLNTNENIGPWIFRVASENWITRGLHFYQIEIMDINVRKAITTARAREKKCAWRE